MKYWLIITFIISVLVISSFASVTGAQGDPTPGTPSTDVASSLADAVATATVVPNAINVRSGPRMHYDIVAYLRGNDSVPVLGTDTSREWIQVEYGPGWFGWAAAHMFRTSIPLENMPITELALADFTRIDNITYVAQKLNNCSATALTMGLTHYGGPEDQFIVGDYLRPSDRDVSVDIAQMETYVDEVFTGVKAVWRMGGTWYMVRRLVAAGFPVIIETSVMVRNEDPPWAGHNRLVIGYDGEMILTYDGYLGHGDFQGLRIHQADLDAVWKQMNRNFLILYEEDREAEVAAILGPHWLVEQNIRLTERMAEAELINNPLDLYAAYNLGAALNLQGRYDEAAAAFDEALDIGGLPVRFHWYRFDLFEALYHVGRYSELIWWAENNLLSMGPSLAAEEAHYWLGMGYAAEGRYDEALLQIQQAVALNTRYQPAQIALWQLQQGTFQPPV